MMDHDRKKSVFYIFCMKRLKILVFYLKDKNDKLIND